MASSSEMISYIAPLKKWSTNILEIKVGHTLGKKILPTCHVLKVLMYLSCLTLNTDEYGGWLYCIVLHWCMIIYIYWVAINCLWQLHLFWGMFKNFYLRRWWLIVFCYSFILLYFVTVLLFCCDFDQLDAGSKWNWRILRWFDFIPVYATLLKLKML